MPFIDFYTINFTQEIIKIAVDLSSDFSDAMIKSKIKENHLLIKCFQNIERHLELASKDIDELEKISGAYSSSNTLNIQEELSVAAKYVINTIRGNDLLGKIKEAIKQMEYYISSQNEEDKDPIDLALVAKWQFIINVLNNSFIVGLEKISTEIDAYKDKNDKIEKIKKEIQNDQNLKEVYSTIHKIEPLSFILNYQKEQYCNDILNRKDKLPNNSIEIAINVHEVAQKNIDQVIKNHNLDSEKINQLLPTTTAIDKIIESKLNNYEEQLKTLKWQKEFLERAFSHLSLSIKQDFLDASKKKFDECNRLSEKYYIDALGEEKANIDRCENLLTKESKYPEAQRILQSIIIDAKKLLIASGLTKTDIKNIDQTSCAKNIESSIEESVEKMLLIEKEIYSLNLLSTIMASEYYKKNNLKYTIHNLSYLHNSIELIFLVAKTKIDAIPDDSKLWNFLFLKESKKYFQSFNKEVSREDIARHLNNISIALDKGHEKLLDISFLKDTIKKQSEAVKSIGELSLKIINYTQAMLIDSLLKTFKKLQNHQQCCRDTVEFCASEIEKIKTNQDIAEVNFEKEYSNKDFFNFLTSELLKSTLDEDLFNKKLDDNKKALLKRQEIFYINYRRINKLYNNQALALKDISLRVDDCKKEFTSLKGQIKSISQLKESEVKTNEYEKILKATKDLIDGIEDLIDGIEISINEASITRVALHANGVKSLYREQNTLHSAIWSNFKAKALILKTILQCKKIKLSNSSKKEAEKFLIKIRKYIKDEGSSYDYDTCLESLYDMCEKYLIIANASSHIGGEANIGEGANTDICMSDLFSSPGNKGAMTIYQAHITYNDIKAEAAEAAAAHKEKKYSHSERYAQDHANDGGKESCSRRGTSYQDKKTHKKRKQPVTSEDKIHIKSKTVYTNDNSSYTIDGPATTIQFECAEGISYNVNGSRKATPEEVSQIGCIVEDSQNLTKFAETITAATKSLAQDKVDSSKKTTINIHQYNNR